MRLDAHALRRASWPRSVQSLSAQPWRAAGVARALIDGLRNRMVVRDDRVRALLPCPLASFDDAARAALSSRSTADW